jgi:hypothetical protein
MSRQTPRPAQKLIQPPTSAKTVAVGFVHSFEVNAFFMNALLGLLDSNRQQVVSVISVLSGPKVDGARNQLFKRWLTETNADYLLMLDTDMVPPVNTLSTLMSHDRDIVGGLCFVGGIGTAVRPTLHVIEPGDDGTPELRLWFDYPADSVVQVAATGGACLLVSRKTAMNIWRARGQDHAMPWFAYGMHNGVEIGEDIAFCLTAGKCGHEVWVDTGLVIPHAKMKFLDTAEYVRSLDNSSHPFHEYREKVPAYARTDR